MDSVRRGRRHHSAYVETATRAVPAKPGAEIAVARSANLLARDTDPPPLYRQVCRHLEELALRQPFDDVSPLPPEAKLVDRLGVSRGTLRRATDELAREGLLRIEPGRGTFVDKATQVRWCGWERLAEVARPDSRFDLDISRFIPDFAGRERCDRLITGLDQYKSAAAIFVAPDNSLQALRELALADGKQVVVPTSGLRRGIVALDPGAIPEQSWPLAATLDGMERFARTLDLAALRALRKIDLVVTGAVAVTRQGVHVDSGTGMFWLEWTLLAHVGVVNAKTPVIASVHDCQLIDAEVPSSPTDAVVDLVVTPNGVWECPGVPKPTGYFPDDISATFFDTVSYLKELVLEGQLLPSHSVRRRR